MTHAKKLPPEPPPAKADGAPAAVHRALPGRAGDRSRLAGGGQRTGGQRTGDRRAGDARAGVDHGGDGHAGEDHAEDHRRADHRTGRHGRCDGPRRRDLPGRSADHLQHRCLRGLVGQRPGLLRPGGPGAGRPTPVLPLRTAAQLLPLQHRRRRNRRDRPRPGAAELPPARRELRLEPGPGRPVLPQGRCQGRCPEPDRLRQQCARVDDHQRPELLGLPGRGRRGRLRQLPGHGRQALRRPGRAPRLCQPDERAGRDHGMRPGDHAGPGRPARRRRPRGRFRTGRAAHRRAGDRGRVQPALGVRQQHPDLVLRARHRTVRRRARPPHLRRPRRRHHGAGRRGRPADRRADLGDGDLLLRLRGRLVRGLRPGHRQRPGDVPDHLQRLHRDP